MAQLPPFAYVAQGNPNPNAFLAGHTVEEKTACAELIERDLWQSTSESGLFAAFKSAFAGTDLSKIQAKEFIRTMNRLFPESDNPQLRAGKMHALQVLIVDFLNSRITEMRNKLDIIGRRSYVPYMRSYLTFWCDYETAFTRLTSLFSVYNSQVRFSGHHPPPLPGHLTRMLPSLHPYPELATLLWFKHFQRVNSLFSETMHLWMDEDRRQNAEAVNNNNQSTPPALVTVKTEEALLSQRLVVHWKAASLALPKSHHFNVRPELHPSRAFEANVLAEVSATFKEHVKRKLELHDCSTHFASFLTTVPRLLAVELTISAAYLSTDLQASIVDSAIGTFIVDQMSHFDHLVNEEDEGDTAEGREERYQKVVETVAKMLSAFPDDGARVTVKVKDAIKNDAKMAVAPLGPQAGAAAADEALPERYADQRMP